MLRESKVPGVRARGGGPWEVGGTVGGEGQGIGRGIWWIGAQRQQRAVLARSGGRAGAGAQFCMVSAHDQNADACE